MLSEQEVAQDETIFRPDGFIQFPRSDGDPNYGPPNTQVPLETDLEVDYHHVFRRDDRRHRTWREALGEGLARYFKLDKLTQSKVKWKLYDFPENYVFAEHRKGPTWQLRTDTHLFGRQGCCFRSTKEVLGHFIWLLLDPDMNPANCRCIYCPKSQSVSTGGNRSPAIAGVKRKDEPTSASSSANADRRRKKSHNADVAEVPAHTSITVRGVEIDRLEPGLAIVSVPQRDLETMRPLNRGENERFRVGEVAWCMLSEPVVDPTCPGRQIEIWPVVILDSAVQVTTMPGYDTDNNNKQRTRARSPLAQSGVGSVNQSMAYQVTFFGTTEKAKVPEASLMPYLIGFIPEDLVNSDLGTRQDHLWLFQDDEYPHLNLSRQPNVAAPEFTKAIVAWGFAVEAVAILRNLYNVTDAYSVSETPQGKARDLGASAAERDNQLASGMRYYQGIYFGLERLWVGDVVRLRLSRSDIKKLQQQLNAVLAAEAQSDASDAKAILLDEAGSYALQLGAIYEDPQAPKTVRVSGEIYQIMAQAKYAALTTDIEARNKRREADDGRDAAARQEEARKLEARLPKSSVLTGSPGFPPIPQVPAGFVMVSLNDRFQARIPREATLTLGHVAGRMYPSLGMYSDIPRVAEQIKQSPSNKKLAADEDTQVGLRARLSVAGLLSGCVKAMKVSSVHTWTRTASFKGALALARKRLDSILSSESGHLDTEETVAASLVKSPTEDSSTSASAAAAAAAAVSMSAETVVAPPRNDTEAPNVAALHMQPAPAPAPAPASAPAPAPVTTSAQQEVSAATTAATTSIEATADVQVSPVSEDTRPLLPGWQARKSRNLGMYYYVHTATKKTQWERPTL